LKSEDELGVEVDVPEEKGQVELELKSLLRY